MRMGQFAGPSEQYGLPLSFVHPVDNDFIKAEFNPILLDPRWKLTDKQRRKLQDEVDKVTDLLQAGRDIAGGYDPGYQPPKRKANPNKRDRRQSARQKRRG